MTVLRQSPFVPLENELEMVVEGRFSTKLLAASRDELFEPDSLLTIGIAWADDRAAEIHMNRAEGQPRQSCTA